MKWSALCRPRRAWLLAAVVLAVLAGGRQAAAQEGTLPAELQAALIGKILTFDRKLDRYGNDLVLGYLYQPGNRESEQLARDLSDATRSLPAISRGGPRLRAVLLAYTDGMPLSATLRREGIDLLYVAPMRATNVRALVAEAAAAGVLTISGHPDPIRAGVAVGLEERARRPAITSRLGQARRAGSDFDSRLLRLADVRP